LRDFFRNPRNSDIAYWHSTQNSTCFAAVVDQIRQLDQTPDIDSSKKIRAPMRLRTLREKPG
jgi:hypothetical protein